MKITRNPITDKVRVESQCGVVSWASYDRIINTMIRAGELRLRPDEKVVGVEMDDHGLKFVIGSE